MSQNLVCGIDEAGRGPVIGPLVLGCALFDEVGREKLLKMRVRDSKKLSPKRREELEPLVKEAAVEWRVAHIQATEIDRLRKTMSLNVIEAQRTAQLILSLKYTPSKILIDAADTVEANYRRKIIESLAALNPEYKMPEIIAEHKADDTYPEVSAASILAKVERDRCIQQLKAYYGEFGSGYPA
ncbi:MAG: ribonuclease HII, partial [Candidatus Altiarchaeota archaeon]